MLNSSSCTRPKFARATGSSRSSAHTRGRKRPIAVTMRDDVLSVRISMSESPVRPGSSVGAGADHFSSTTKSHYQDQLREGLSFKPTVYHKVCRWRLKHHLPT